MTVKQDSKKQDDKLVAICVRDVIQESDDVRTYRFNNSEGLFAPHKPGMFVKVCLNINGDETWRSFTLSSSPLHPERIDFRIKRNHQGEVGHYFFEHIGPGSEIKIKGPLGHFFYDQELHTEPVVLLCAGIGITPMMSIVRYLSEIKPNNACSFFYGDKSQRDMIFHQELRQLTRQLPNFQYFLTLSQPSPQWSGDSGHLNFEYMKSKISQVPFPRYFLCGPDMFNQVFEEQLLAAGVPDTLIHSEQFHKKRKSK